MFSCTARKVIQSFASPLKVGKRIVGSFTALELLVVVVAAELELALVVSGRNVSSISSNGLSTCVTINPCS